ncbi:MAG: L-methionine (R)-S-oxide reductase, partial [Paraglaciecola sp.]
MAEGLIVEQVGDKRAQYEQLMPQIEALVTGEDDLIANL